MARHLIPLAPFLARRWFLLAVVAGVALAAVRPGWLGWTLWLDASACGTLAVFLSAWGLEGRRLWGAAARPLPALWAVLISYGFLPALGWLTGLLLPPDFRLGLLLVVSVPCTLNSAVIWTRLAGGNEATALLITLLTNATGWLATTAWLVLAAGVRDAAALQAGPMMLRLLLVLVVPVAAGQLCRAAGPLARAADRHKTALGVVARLLTVVIMLKAAVEVRGRLDGEEAGVSAAALVAVAVLCVGLHLAALAGGLWGAARLGFDRPSRIAVAFAGSQKTLPISLILFDAYFTGFPLAVVPLAFYHAGQLVVDTFIADGLAGRGHQDKMLSAGAGSTLL